MKFIGKSYRKYSDSLRRSVSWCAKSMFWSKSFWLITTLRLLPS